MHLSPSAHLYPELLFLDLFLFPRRIFLFHRRKELLLINSLHLACQSALECISVE